MSWNLKQLTETFERDGVIELGQVLEPAEVAELRGRMERLMYRESGEVAPEVRDLSETKGKPLTYSVMQLVNVWSLDPVFDRLARRDDLLDLMQALLGPDLQLLRDQSFYKPPGHGGEIFLHQDNRYWHLDPPHVVTLWLALDDATIENGCVHFLKGSHTVGRVSHHRAMEGESILLEADADKAKAVPIEVPAGHATVHHCHLVHWSPPNRTDRPRLAHTIQYMAAGLRKDGEPCVDFPLLRGHLRMPAEAS
jgi:2-oxoglutarate-dependent dioxygenase